MEVDCFFFVCMYSHCPRRDAQSILAITLARGREHRGTGHGVDLFPLSCRAGAVVPDGRLPQSGPGP